MNITLLMFRLVVLMVASVGGSLGFQWFILKEWKKGFAMLFSAFVSTIIPFWIFFHVGIWMWSLVGTQLCFEERYGKAWDISFTHYH